MMLAPNEHAYIAQRAQWLFDIAISPRNSPMAFGDTVAFTGCGVRDLNQTIAFISANPQCRVTCEVGSGGVIPAGNAFPKYRQADIEDVYEIKNQFIAYYGSVDRPDAFVPFNSGAFQAKVLP